jgi:hypothetical protein
VDPARRERLTTKKDHKKQEDDYLARMEFERRKKALEEQQEKMKSAEKEKLKNHHWMRFPKCGMQMLEVGFEGIRVDKCSSCLGIFFDDGELDQLIEKNKPGFLHRLTSVFKD